MENFNLSLSLSLLTPGFNYVLLFSYASFYLLALNESTKILYVYSTDLGFLLSLEVFLYLKLENAPWKKN